PTRAGNGIADPVSKSKQSAPPLDSRQSSIDSPNPSKATDLTTARQDTPAGPRSAPSNSAPLRHSTTAAAPAPTASACDVSDMARRGKTPSFALAWFDLILAHNV